jgi:hypothetical protein
MSRRPAHFRVPAVTNSVNVRHVSALRNDDSDVLVEFTSREGLQLMRHKQESLSKSSETVMAKCDIECCT